MVDESESKLEAPASSPSSDLILVGDADEDAAEDLECTPRWRSEPRWEQPGGMCRISCATLVVGLDEVAEEAFGVPARDAAAEEGLVGETEPPLERWEELQPLPSLVGEEVVEDGIVNEDSWSVWEC